MAIETRVDAAARMLARAKLRDLEDALDLIEAGADILRRQAGTESSTAASALEKANAAVSVLQKEIVTETAKAADADTPRRAVKVAGVEDGVIADDLAARADQRMSA